MPLERSARSLALPLLSLVTTAFVCSAAGASEPWIPVEPGVRHVHQYRSTKVLTVDARTVKKESETGTREYATYTGDARFGAPSVEIRSTLRTRSSAAAPETVKQTSEYVEPTEVGYRILGSELEWGGERRMVRYPKPLAMLPERLEANQPWYVGRGVMDGLELDVHGKILGVQDAQTAAGTFEKCLVVEYTREISGSATDPARGSLEILSGKSVTHVWYARGVGEVFVRDTTDMRVRAPELGIEGDVSAKTESWLSARESFAASSPASPSR